MTLAYNIANDPELRKAFKMGGVRLTLRTLSKFDTVDARHLKVRLRDENPVPDITKRAEGVLSQEGTLIPYNKIDPDRIKAELEMLLNPQVSAADIKSERFIVLQSKVILGDWLRWVFPWKSHSKLLTK